MGTIIRHLSGRAVWSAAVLASLLFAGVASARTELVMAEQRGCIWCARFDAEIAPAYPKTDEARRAPLRRVSIDDPLPEDLVLDSPVLLTPTFILVRDGQEIDRIEGYPGQEFFWPMLDEMLDEAGITPAPQP